MKMKRKLFATYVDTSATATAAYERLGKDLEEFNVEMGANVNTKKNILGETVTEIDGYEKSASIEPYYAVDGEAMFTKLQDIVDNEKIYDDLKTTVVEVHLWDETETTGTFVAFREDAIIEVSSYGGDSTGYQIPYNLHFTGNRVQGTFVLSTKTFTADA